MTTTYLPDLGARDASIAINSYTTVLRREGVPHDLFDTYWRDVHGPLCSRVPGLGYYIQFHFDRYADAHLWPLTDGMTGFDDYVLDGAVEIGFADAERQRTFQDASPILFSDERNAFDATVAYALPDGSRTFVDRLVDPVPNGDGFDRMHVHFGIGDVASEAFAQAMTDLAGNLAGDPALLRVRLHLPETYDNANPAPPAPNVAHDVPAERTRIAILDLAFATPLARRRFFASKAFAGMTEGLASRVAHVASFLVTGTYTYVRDGDLTLAGLRGSRTAQLIERIGAVNQVGDDVRHLIRTGDIDCRCAERPEPNEGDMTCARWS